MTYPINKISNKIKLVLMIHEGGNHTNLQAIQNAINDGKINAEISTVISDNEDAVPVLKKASPDYICLAGWKKIIPDEIVADYPGKILNLHPGLIPDTINDTVKNPDNTPALWNKGMYGDKAIQNFLDQKATYAGSTIHFLTLDFDFGPVLGRTFEKIDEYDNVESLYSRLKKRENSLYVEVLSKLTSPPAPLLDKERVAEGPVRYKKILMVGAGGGREHALGWKIAQSPRAGKLFFARGNAGTSQIGTNLDIRETDIPELLEFATKEHIDLTLVVSDEPLASGVVDAFTLAGLRVWGPTKAAAELEWSKAYAKDFMKRHNIPTAHHAVFNNFEKARNYIEKGKFPIVVKASGLALGKGVTIAQTKEEATEALRKIMIDKIFGASGNEVVIEEFLEGIEISIHALSDGKNYKIFPASQDHKRIFDGNVGPNTGGMGVIAPLPFVDDALMAKIEREIIAPTIKGMRSEGREFVGCLYPGIMLTAEGPKVFEFNTRFGDPEAQTYMRLMENDLLDAIDACIDGTLEDQKIEWQGGFACNIALASGGYPSNYEKGKKIMGIEEAESDPDIVIFHAGTKIDNKGELATNGGRVLGVSTVGNNLQEALDKAYQAIQKISFEGMQFRKDIGKAALEMIK